MLLEGGQGLRQLFLWQRRLVEEAGNHLGYKA
jgi:hypothetical protein